MFRTGYFGLRSSEGFKETKTVLFKGVKHADSGIMRQLYDLEDGESSNAGTPGRVSIIWVPTIDPAIKDRIQGCARTRKERDEGTFKRTGTVCFSSPELFFLCDCHRN